MFTSRITNGLRFAIKNRQSFLHTSTPIKSKEIPNNTIEPIKYTTSITGFLVVLTCLNVLNVSTTHNNNRKHVQEIIRKSEDEDDKKNGGGGTPIYL